MDMWMNRATGELLTRAEMRKQGAALYDLETIPTP